MRLLLGLTDIVGKRIQKRSAVFVLLFFPLNLTFRLDLPASPNPTHSDLVDFTDALIGHPPFRTRTRAERLGQHATLIDLIPRPRHIGLGRAL